MVSLVEAAFVGISALVSYLSFARSRYVGAFGKFVLGSGLQATWFDVDPIPLLTKEKAYRLVEMMPYKSDIVNWGQSEYFARASETLERESGDCDDKSILLASFWLGMGYSPVVVVADTIKGGHAFVEMDGKVYDPTWDEYEVPREEYYSRYGVSPTFWFTRDYYGKY
jgi:hypothetical protein